MKRESRMSLFFKHFHMLGACLSALLIASLALGLPGCATPGGEPPEFAEDAVPAAEAEALDPADLPGAGNLVQAAREALEAANEAQEQGDQEAALRNYTLMLELLIDADLDPELFYRMRGKFDEILAATSDRLPEYRPQPISEIALFEPPPTPEDVLLVEQPLHPRVLTEIEEIQGVYPKNFQAGLNRSGRYAPYIRKELEKAGLPEDLMWLAMVESQFTPKIISRAGAGGMWQFMRGTAQRYNLRIDSYVDERFDWQRCTDAAIGYLSDLYELFENWPLAVSAYNRGENGIERAIAANGGERDLWRLLDTPPASYSIPLETKKFYPKLVASIICAKDPGRYGLKYEPLQPEPTERVATKGCYSLSALEDACGLKRDALTRLNPHLIRGVTPPDSYDLIVPAGWSAKMKAALVKAPKLRPGVHVVRRGETISHIAARYRVSQSELMRLNKIVSARRLQVGQKLVIPGSTGLGVESTPSSAAPSASGHIYAVRRGDTLYDIAKAQRVTVAQLQRWNSLGSRSRIYVGQKLHVAEPQGGTAPAAESGEKLVHTVRAGEYPARIARQYGVSLDDFLRWNNLTKRSTIQIGQKLVIYGRSAPGKASAAESAPEAQPAPSKGQPPGSVKRVHKVASGENPSVIAAQYGVRTGDFLAWNGLSKQTVLHIGDEYVVYVPGDSEAQEAEAPQEPAANEGAAPAGKKKVVHVVARGHNPTTIARRYKVRLSDLFAWNGWDKNVVLHIGDKVTVYVDE